MKAALRRLIDEGDCSNICVGLLAFRLFAVGAASIALLNEYPTLSIIAIIMAIFTLSFGTRHQKAVPVLHILASAIWAGAAVSLLLKDEWIFAAVLLLLSVLETTIASMRVRTAACNI